METEYEKTAEAEIAQMRAYIHQVDGMVRSLLSTLVREGVISLHDAKSCIAQLDSAALSDQTYDASLHDMFNRFSSRSEVE